MTTQTPSSDALALPQQQAFDNSADAFNKVYADEQNELQKAQQEAANMTSWADMLGFFATLSVLAQLMTATQVLADCCGESVAGLLQGAESIFAQSMTYVNAMSQQIWTEDSQNGEEYLDNGIPVPSVEDLNNNFSNQVEYGNEFFEYMQDIVYDVSGDAFTDVDSNGQAVNPLQGIQEQVNNAAEDIGYQIYSVDETMANNLYYNGEGYVYIPSTTSESSSGTYETNGNGQDYLFDPPPISTYSSSPMYGATLGDDYAYFMLGSCYMYGEQVQYDMVDESNPTVYAPEMSQSTALYQVSTDMETINASTTGIAPQSMPKIGFLTNLTSNCLAIVGNWFRDTATLCETIIQNTGA